MRTTPVVNRHAPPPQRFFGGLGFGKGQGSAYLGGAHESGCAITPLNSRRVGYVVTQSVQSLGNALFAAVSIPDFYRLQPMSTVVFDDLNMCGRPGDAETRLRMRSSWPLPGWIVGIPKYLGKQGAIRRQTVREQGYLMTVGQAGGTLCQQLSDQAVISYPLDMSHNELAAGVHQLCFPGWVLLAARKAVPFIGLQFGHGHRVYFLFMILLPVPADLLAQTANGTWVYLDQTCRTLNATAVGQVFGHRDSAFFRDFTIPQGRVFSFAEFLLAEATAQVTDVVPTIGFSESSNCRCLFDHTSRSLG